MLYFAVRLQQNKVPVDQFCPADLLQIVQVHLFVNLWTWIKNQEEEKKEEEDDQQLKETMKEEAMKVRNEKEESGKMKEKEKENKNLFHDLQQKRESAVRKPQRTYSL